MSAGDTPSTSALLSNPAAESSGGSIALTSTSSASRSRMALRVLGAVQPMQRRRARIGMQRRGAIELRFERRCERVARRRGRLRRGGRRHHPGAQLAHDLFPDVDAAVHLRGIRPPRATRSPRFARALWQPAQYRVTKRRDGARRPPVDAGVWPRRVTDAATTATQADHAPRAIVASSSCAPRPRRRRSAVRQPIEQRHRRRLRDR